MPLVVLSEFPEAVKVTAASQECVAPCVFTLMFVACHA